MEPYERAARALGGMGGSRATRRAGRHRHYQGRQKGAQQALGAAVAGLGKHPAGATKPLPVERARGAKARRKAQRQARRANRG